MGICWHITKYTFIESFGNRLFLQMVALLLIIFQITEFMGQLVVFEQQAFQATIVGTMVRLTIVILVSFFVISATLREKNDKQLEVLLALPLSRTQYYFGKLVGFSTLAIVIALLSSFLILIYAPFKASALWLSSLIMELVLIVSLSLALAYTLKHTTSALIAMLVFYIAGRSLGSFLLIAESTLTPDAALSDELIRHTLALLHLLVPDFSDYSPSEWLAYANGDWFQLLKLAGQTTVYLSLLSAICLVDLHRKHL